MSTPMVRGALTIVLSGALLGAAMPAPYAQDAGSVSGTVTLLHVKGAALPSAAYPGRTVGDRQAPTLPDLKNVVVYIKGAPLKGTPSAKTAELKQEHEMFMPHVVATTRGSKVLFPNGDPFFHNVFSLSSAASFDLGRYPTGQSKDFTLSKAGIVKVFCKIHSHMSATILVFDHPYFTIPEADGRYELTGVPPGDYAIVGWHERVGERIVPIKIERGKTAVVDLKLPLEDVK